MLHARRRGWWSGLLYSGAFYAIMLAALVGGYVLPAVGWRWTFVISGAPVLIVFYIRMRAPESKVWSQAVKHEDRGGAKAFARRSFIRPFVKCFVAAGLYFWAYYGVTTLLPTHLVSLGFSMSKASWWIFFTAVSGLLGCWAGPHFADRWGRRPTVAVLMALSVIGGTVLYLVGDTLIATAAIFIPFFVLYFGSNAATVYGALFSEAFPTEVRSTGVSASLQVARGTAGLPPILAAAIIPDLGYGVVFLGGAVLYAAAGLWVWTFTETKGFEVDRIDQQTRSQEFGTTVHSPP